MQGDPNQTWSGAVHRRLHRCAACVYHYIRGSYLSDVPQGLNALLKRTPKSFKEECNQEKNITIKSKWKLSIIYLFIYFCNDKAL